ncbi:hypothetical protein GCM10020220_107860 [Nonomuraea rubra]|uniref:hypothetical protein n=1 Tax=Nonomuraea rubra TaxID=46180 RepID=UPI0031E7AF03
MFENGKDQVYRKWIFVPGYYQGKAPWGVYVGAYAFTAYDLDTYDDYDGDYAFVAVHNGFALTGSKEVVKSEFHAWGGDKWVKHEEIKKEEYDAGFDKYGPAGPYWSKDFDVTPEKVAHNYTGEKILTKVEVTESAYGKAPKDTRERPSTASSTSRPARPDQPGGVQEAHGREGRRQVPRQAHRHQGRQRQRDRVVRDPLLHQAVGEGRQDGPLLPRPLLHRPGQGPRPPRRRRRRPGLRLEPARSASR